MGIEKSVRESYDQTLDFFVLLTVSFVISFCLQDKRGLNLIKLLQV